MAEVRCPMCGKPNPAELEVCQFCQARLKPLTGAISSKAESPPASSESSDFSLDDWLGSLRAGDEEQETQPAPAEAEREDDGSDWLANLRQQHAPLFSGPEDASKAGSPPAEGQDELPDWLADIRSQAVQEEPRSPDQSAPAAPLDVDLEPDWLRRVRVRKQQDGLDEPSPGEPAVPAAEPAENLPSWLSEINRPTQAETPPTELPDWLAASQPPAAPSSEEIQPEAGVIPDWLIELGQKTTQPPPEKSARGEAGPSPDAGTGQQDWLAGPQPVSESGSVPLKGEPVPGFNAPEQAEDIPNWLSDLMGVQGEAAQAAGATQPDALTSQPFGAGSGALPAKEGSEPGMDWLEAQEANAVELPPFQGEEIESGSQAPELEGAVNPFVDESPDWIGGVEGESQPLAVPGLIEDSGLARAELPSWLEAMRPVEAAASVVPIRSGDEQKVVSSGPLAGLKGVLSAEPDVSVQRTPAAYSLKLQLNDVQQAQVEMLETMIKTEGLARALPEKPALTSQHLLRLIIFVLLALAVVVPPALGLEVVAPPAISSAVFDARSAVDSLAGSQPVLVAVDFPAAFAGELETAVEPLLHHLMLKGSYLALVSSQPGGPAQAERLISLVNASGGHTYQGIKQYANLGYIPGGMAGLFAFIRSPRQVLPAPLNANGEPAWEQLPLGGVQTISDFALVVVVTDSPETARSWIEQTHTGTAVRSLVMVVSAQAEPAVRPYYEGEPRQVSGMLAGLAGGAAYDASLVRTGRASKYWAALSFGGVLAAALIILLGLAGWSLDRLGRAKPRRASKEGAA